MITHIPDKIKCFVLNEVMSIYAQFQQPPRATTPQALKQKDNK